MVDMAKIEQLVDSYVKEWEAQQIQEHGTIWEGFGGDYEKWSVFRSFGVETFSHQELCQLSPLLTRSLRGAINIDHRTFWSWCVLVAKHSHFFLRKIQLFQDME